MIATFVALGLLQAASTQSPAPAAPPPAAPCGSEGQRAFDFWVGEWVVYPNGSDKPVARSTIERLYSGCAIRENWNPFQGGSGGSLNSFDPATGRWHQTWVGSASGRVEFEGGKAGAQMVLTGYWAGVGGPEKDGLVRMIYTPNDDGSVRQFGEVSYDHGLKWEASFDFIYRPHKELLK